MTKQRWFVKNYHKNILLTTRKCTPNVTKQCNKAITAVSTETKNRHQDEHKMIHACTCGATKKNEKNVAKKNTTNT